MTEPTTERQTATTTTGTTGSTTTAQPAIVFSPQERLLIESDARRAVASRPLRRRY